MMMTNPVRSPRSKLLSAKGDKTQFLVFSAKRKNFTALEFIIIMYTVAGYRNYYSIYKERKKKGTILKKKSNWAVRSSYFVGLKTPC